MAKGRTTTDFQDVIDKCLARGEVYQPADQFISGLSLCPKYIGKPKDLLEAVMKMVTLAKGKKAAFKTEKKRKAWLKEAAKALDSYQLTDRSWICKNVWELPPLPSPKEQAEYDPSAGTKDIRFYPSGNEKGNKQVDVLEVELSKEEEDILLRSPEKPMEVDPPKPTESPRKSPRLAKKVRFAEASESDRTYSSSSKKLPAPDKPEQTGTTRTHRTYSSVLKEIKSKSTARKDKTSSSRPRSGDRTASPSGPRSSDRTVSFSIPKPSDRTASSSLIKEPVVEKVSSASSSSTSRQPSVTSEPRAFSSGKEGPRQFKTLEPVTRTVSIGRGTTVELPATSESTVGSIKHPTIEPLVISASVTGKRKATEVIQEFREKSGEEIQKSKRQRMRHHTCWVPGCSKPNRYIKAHAFNYHIPGIFSEYLPASDPQVLRGRSKALSLAACWLLGRPATLEELLTFINMQHVLAVADNSSISAVQEKAMVEMCTYHSFSVPNRFNLQPANSPAVLLHWKAVLLIAASLDEEERTYWMQNFPAPEGFHLDVAEESEPEEETLIEAFDSHFHLDRSLKEHKLPACGTLDDILAAIPVAGNESLNLVGTVAVFCDPKTYPSGKRLLDLPETMSVAVGFHPKHAHYSQQSTNDYIRDLRSLLEKPRVGALGEIGLDHTEDMKYWSVQVDLLKRVLPLLKERHILVLHCRGMKDDCGTEAYLLLLYVLKKHVGTHHPIHLHCFTGNEYVLQRWLEVFPRTYFGFTNMVRNFRADQVRALCSIEESRLLLESDAPYFPLSGARWSTPGQLYTAAKAVATHRGVSAEHILEVTVINARHLYQRRE